MGGWLASGVCCCFACCCKEILQSFKRLLGVERVTKLFHIILVLVFLIPSIFVFFFLNYWEKFFDIFKTWISCPNASSQQNQSSQCIGSSVIFRLSFSHLCLFLLLTFFMLCRNRCSMVVNQGLFCFKYLFIVVLFIILLFSPNQIYIEFAQISKYIAIIFMILQAIILIDLFYLAGIKMARNYGNGQIQYACYLIICTIIIEVAAVAVNIYGYIIFNACSQTLWVNMISTIILLILPILQIFNFNHQNSLLTTALVSLYVAYFNFMAQFSYDSTCNKITIESLVTDIIVSTFFFILTMYGSIMGGSGQVKVNKNLNLNQQLGLVSSKKQDEEQQSSNNHQVLQQQRIQSSKEEISYTSSYLWVYFHLQMCLSAFYVGMLLTNWGSVSIVTGKLEQSGFAFWIRIIFSWLTTLIYIWTLIVPKIFPERDFTVQ